MIRRRSHQTCSSLPGSSLLSSLPLRSHQKAPLRGLALLILISQTRPTHPHTHILLASSPFHLTSPAPLLSCAGWYGTPWWRRTREDKSRILVKWFGWRIRCSPPTASPPLPLSTHPHTHILPAPSPFHSTTQPTTITPSPLSSSPAPGGMGHLGGGGQGRTRAGSW